MSTVSTTASYANPCTARRLPSAWDDLYPHLPWRTNSHFTSSMKLSQAQTSSSPAKVASWLATPPLSSACVALTFRPRVTISCYLVSFCRQQTVYLAASTAVCTYMIFVMESDPVGRGIVLWMEPPWGKRSRRSREAESCILFIMKV